MRTALGRWDPQASTIMHGDAPGLDRMVDAVALDMSWPRACVKRVPAKWNLHPRGAGAIRNRVMLSHNPSLVSAFWDGESPGTFDCLKEAVRRGFDFEIHGPGADVFDAWLDARPVDPDSLFDPEPFTL